MVEQNKRIKRYKKLFKRLLSETIHNAMVMYRSLQNTVSLKFGLHLYKASRKNTVLVYLILYTAVHRLNHYMKAHRRHFLEHILAAGKKRCAENMGNGAGFHLDRCFKPYHTNPNF